MYQIIVIFIVITQLALARTAEPQPDIVVIDTGLNFDIHGVLDMNKNPVPEKITRARLKYYPTSGSKPQYELIQINPDEQWKHHGSWMVLSLADQIGRLKMDPVQGKMLRWQNQGDLVSKIREAVRLKAKVINLSLCGGEEIKAEKQAIKEACDRNIVVVAASGNSGGISPEYPAGYDLPCLVAVSSWKNDRIPSGANLGDIYVPLYYDHEQGTSFSTARASAYALDYLRKNPNAKASEVKNWLRAEMGPKQLAVQLSHGGQ